MLAHALRHASTKLKLMYFRAGAWPVQGARGNRRVLPIEVESIEAPISVGMLRQTALTRPSGIACMLQPVNHFRHDQVSSMRMFLYGSAQMTQNTIPIHMFG